MSKTRRASSSSAKKQKNKHKSKRRDRQDERRTSSVDSILAHKEDLLSEALGRDQRSAQEIRLLALSDGGLGASRQRAWSLLLQLDNAAAAAVASQQQEEEDEREPIAPKVAHQIEIDSARSFGSLPAGLGASKRAELKHLLLEYFSCNPHLHYYQGFHDVAVVVMQVFQDCDFSRQLLALRQLSENYIFLDAHDADFFKVERILYVVQDLIALADTGALASQTALFPFWGVSMLISNFAHDVAHDEAKLRLFDAMIASPPHFVLYLVASLPLLPSVREEILAGNCSNAHESIRNAARGIDSVQRADELVRVARGLEERFPAAALLLNVAEAKHGVPRTSVLFKTPCVLCDTWVPPPPVVAAAAPVRSIEKRKLDRRRILVAIASLAVLVLAYWVAAARKSSRA